MGGVAKGDEGDDDREVVVAQQDSKSTIYIYKGIIIVMYSYLGHNCNCKQNNGGYGDAVI